MDKAIHISISYPGPLNQDLDQILQQALENIGAVWTGQGTDFESGIRDIGFELDLIQIAYNNDPKVFFESLKKIDIYTQIRRVKKYILSKPDILQTTEFIDWTHKYKNIILSNDPKVLEALDITS